MELRLRRESVSSRVLRFEASCRSLGLLWRYQFDMGVDEWRLEGEFIERVLQDGAISYSSSKPPRLVTDRDSTSRHPRSTY